MVDILLAEQKRGCYRLFFTIKVVFDLKIQKQRGV